MRNIIISVVATILVLAIGGWLFMLSGMYDISQLKPHTAIVKWIINTTKKHSIKSRLDGIQVPNNLGDTSMIVMGFRHYNEMCICCHGGPGIHQWEMAKGLYPHPPTLFKFANKLEPVESFWIIKNGIKMTSMPGYGPTHSDEKIWSIISFLTKKLGNMTPAEYKEWTKKYGGSGMD